jgi:3-isopropylmalate dehydratase small subunit
LLKLQALDQQGSSSPFAVLLAGDNFGRDVPRRELLLRIREVGIRVVVAESFCPHFYEACQEFEDLFALESEYRLCDGFETGDCVEVDLQRFHLRDANGSAAYPLRPLSRVA